MLRKVLVGFDEAEGPRPESSDWRGDPAPHGWLRTFPGGLWDVVGIVMPQDEQWYDTPQASAQSCKEAMRPHCNEYNMSPHKL